MCDLENKKYVVIGTLLKERIFITMFERHLKKLAQTFVGLIVLYFAYVALKYYFIYFVKIFGWLYELPLRVLKLKYNERIDYRILLAVTFLMLSIMVAMILVNEDQNYGMYYTLVALLIGYFGFISLFSVLTRKINHRTLKLYKKNNYWG